MKTCPFNARHVIREDNLAYHMTKCPDRASIMSDIKYQKKRREDGARNGGDCSVPPYNDWTPPPSKCSENWDNEIDENRVFYYRDPNRHKETRNVFCIDK